MDPFYRALLIFYFIFYFILKDFIVALRKIAIKLQMDQAKSLQEAYPGPSPSIITKNHKDSWGMGGNFGRILGGSLGGHLGENCPLF